MSEIGDFCKALDAVFEIGEHAAALRMMRDFWHHLEGRKHCQRCGKRRHTRDLRPFRVGMASEASIFNFCARCASHVKRTVAIVPTWTQMVYGFGVTVPRQGTPAMMTRVAPTPKPWKSHATARKRARQRKVRPRSAR